MDEEAIWYGGSPVPRGLCVRWGPSPPPQGLSPGDFVFDGAQIPQKKGAPTPPNFWPMSIVAKRLDG